MGGMTLPPGPREPAALQTVEWIARPTAFLRRCRARHGDPFTVRVAWADAPMVLVSDPEAIRRVFAAGPAVAARRRELDRAASRSPARPRSCSPTAPSTCAAAGELLPPSTASALAALARDDRRVAAAEVATLAAPGGRCGRCRACRR